MLLCPRAPKKINAANFPQTIWECSNRNTTREIPKNFYSPFRTYLDQVEIKGSPSMRRPGVGSKSQPFAFHPDAPLPCHFRNSGSSPSPARPISAQPRAALGPLARGGGREPAQGWAVKGVVGSARGDFINTLSFLSPSEGRPGNVTHFHAQEVVILARMRIRMRQGGS